MLKFTNLLFNQYKPDGMKYRTDKQIWSVICKHVNFHYEIKTS